MSGPLTDDQQRQLRAALGTLKDTLTEQLASSREGARPVDLDEPIGRLSRMDAMQQQKMTQSNRRQAEARLRLVVAAIAAYDRGEFGDCHDCQEPIGYKRLKARPETRFCLECQSARENRD